METPLWLLSVAYWIHMAATAVWLGGLFWLSAFNPPSPAPGATAGPDPGLRLLRRFLSLAWLSLAVLTASGLVQMAANPYYEGTLAVVNPWSRALLAKHVVVLLMAAVTAHLQWAQLPALERLLIASRRRTVDLGPLQRRMLRFNRLNLALGGLVLLLTALARTA